MNRSYMNARSFTRSSGVMSYWPDRPMTLNNLLEPAPFKSDWRMRRWVSQEAPTSHFLVGADSGVTTSESPRPPPTAPALPPPPDLSPPPLGPAPPRPSELPLPT